MAVFFVNNCKFGKCGVTFPTLQQLIRHIEETHIDFEHELQQPSSLPLSYVLRIFKESPKKTSDVRKRSHSPASSVCSTGNTPTGSEMDDDFLSDSDDSCDSWASKDDVNSEFILRMLGAGDNHDSKPFACPIPGCKKRYKNVSGIKYHAKNGHNKDTKKNFSRVVKGYKCHCGKSYKTSHGLKTHMATQHCQGLLAKQNKNQTPETMLANALGSETHSFVHNGSQKTIIGLSPNQASIAVKSKAFPDDKLIHVGSYNDNAVEHKLLKPPPLSPILQQHLLSPVLPKKSSPSHGQVVTNGFGDHQYPQ